MSDELGLNFTFISDGELYAQYIHEGSEGNVLDAFYSKFTVEFMIEKIKEDMDKDEKYVGQMCSLYSRGFKKR
jgi:hypothetical protein